MRDYKSMDDFWFYELFVKWVYYVDESEREKLLMKIIEYGTERNTDISDITDPTARAIFPQVKFSIAASKKRHIKAVENGKKGGRPRKVWSDEYIGELQYMVSQGYSVKQIAEHFHISLSSAYRYIKKYPIPQCILEAKKKRQPYIIGGHNINQWGFERTAYRFGEERRPDDYSNMPIPTEELDRRYEERMEAEARSKLEPNPFEIDGKKAYEQQKARNLENKNTFRP